MCRHLAYLGTPVSLAMLLLHPPHSLSEQAYAPRLQKHGNVNVDGFGTGWYVPGRSEPVRYRRAQPIWSDMSFAGLAPTVESPCILAAVRDATPGFPSDESCTAPFTHQRWLFSHNGKVADFSRVRKSLHHALADVPEALAHVDSAFLFGLAVSRWESGASLADGLAGVVRDVAAAGGGRLNLLASDGTDLAATTYGETLFTRVDTGSVLLASEPYDDDPSWDEIPPGHLVTAGPAGVAVTPLRTEDS